MTKFKEVGKELQTEAKDDATGMIRNFCVLTLEAYLNPSTNEWTQEYTNHRVLVGSQAKLDACKKAIEGKLDGSEWTFKKNE